MAVPGHLTAGSDRAKRVELEWVILDADKTLRILNLSNMRFCRWTAELYYLTGVYALLHIDQVARNSGKSNNMAARSL